jgi:hypothetical protein
MHKIHAYNIHLSEHPHINTYIYIHTYISFLKQFFLIQVVGIGAATASISAIAQLSDQKSASRGNFVGGIGVLAAITAALAGVYMQSPQAVTIEV